MKRIYSIQYLRAVAALAVVALHTGKRAGAELPGGVKEWLELGNAGVDLFFVISGFIMWSISTGSASSPGGFLVRRAVRVAPPYWIATALWVLMITVIGYDWISTSVPHLVKSFLFVPHYSPTFPDHILPVLVPGWTLNYEMFFYLVFAATLVVSGPARFGALAAVLLGLVLAGYLIAPTSAWAVTYTSPLLLEFLGGCVVAQLWMTRPGHFLRNLVVLCLGVGLLIWAGPHVGPHDYMERALFYGGPCVLIVWATLGLGAYVPRIRMLERLGDGSYAIYLFHLLLVVPLGEVWARLPMLHSGPGAILFVIVTMCLVSQMGVWIFRYLEQPMQRGLTALLLSKPGEKRLASR